MRVCNFCASQVDMEWKDKTPSHKQIPACFLFLNGSHPPSRGPMRPSPGSASLSDGVFFASPRSQKNPGGIRADDGRCGMGRPQSLRAFCSFRRVYGSCLRGFAMTETASPPPPKERQQKLKRRPNEGYNVDDFDEKPWLDKNGKKPGFVNGYL